MKQNGSPVSPEILVVDDEADIRELMAGILADEGFDTRVASDSDAALNSIAPTIPGCSRPREPMQTAGFDHGCVWWSFAIKKG